MSKKSVRSSKKTTSTNQIDIGRGVIQDDFLAAIVTSKMYKMQIVKAKKGKGSFQRKEKHKGNNKGQDSYLIAA